jgi:hypothetical protein
MTVREATIVSAYTGFLIGSFSEFHKFVEEIMERPIWTHELMDNKIFNEIQEKAKPYYIKIKIE